MTRINKSLADCAALIMKDGDIVNYRSPLSILIYDYYALAMVLKSPHLLQESSGPLYRRWGKMRALMLFLWSAAIGQALY